MHGELSIFNALKTEEDFFTFKTVNLSSSGLVSPIRSEVGGMGAVGQSESISANDADVAQAKKAFSLRTYVKKSPSN